MQTRRTLTITTVVAAVLALSSIVAVAGPWSEKVTGGGDAAAGAIAFTFSTSASDVGGQFQYHREGQGAADLTFHGVVDCLIVAEDGESAVFSGVISHASVPHGGFVDGATVTVAVLEGGEGSGDRVRVWNGGECTDHVGYSGPFPGVYTDGNITIRTR